MPFKGSNIPASIFYNCINAEILRICRASSKMEYALKTSKDQIQRMMRQGQRAKSSNKLRAELNTIYTGILRCFNRHKTVIAKYDKTPNQFLALLLARLFKIVRKRAWRGVKPGLIVRVLNERGTI